MESFFMQSAPTQKPVEKENFYDKYPSMIRLTYKGKLIDDCLKIYEQISKKIAVAPKSFRRKANRTITRDFMKGISVINKKNKIYVEMPELKSVGNGMIKKVNPKTKGKKGKDDEEIEVHDSLPPSNSGFIEYTEN